MSVAAMVSAAIQALNRTVAGLLIGHELAFFATLAALVLVVLLGMAVLLVRARRRWSAETAAVAEANPLPVPDAPPAVAAIAPPATTSRWRMWRAFRHGLRAQRAHAGRGADRYATPWILLLGPDGAGKSAVLDAAGPGAPPTALADPRGAAPPDCVWWLFDDAVVLEVPGHVTRLQDALNDGGWPTLLRRLRGHRPRRPVDSVVLAVPVTDFLGPAALAPSQLREQALQMQTRLFQARETLGICLPVHVVLTRCDALPGFLDLARALPAGMADSVFGWSSPYPLDAAFSADWLDDGFAELDAGLLQLQLELHAAGATGAAPADLFDLSGQIQALREPLQRFLGLVFRRAAFRESLYFRGFYLTAAPPTASPAFVRAAFHDRVFAERDLSRPSRPAMLSFAQRRRLAWSAAALAGVPLLVGLWRSVEQASAWRDDLVPALRRIAVDAAAAATAAPAEPAGPRVRRFAADLAALDPPFRSLLLPGSLFDDVGPDVAGALAVAFRRVVLAPARARLEADLRGLPAPDAEGAPPSPGTAFDGLRDYVGRIVRLEAAAATYDALANAPAADPQPSARAADRLPALLAGTWGIDAPAGLAGRVADWAIAAPPARARAVVPTPPLAPVLLAVQPGLVARLDQLADAAFGQLAGAGAATPLLTAAAADLATAVQPGRTADEVIAALGDARDQLQRASLQVGIDADSWAGQPAIAFSPALQAVLDQVGRSALLGPAARDRLVERAQRRFDAAGPAGRSATSVIGPLLSWEAKPRDGSAASPAPPGGQAALSPAAVGLVAALGDWLGRGFMRELAPGDRSGDADGWNPQLLATAGGLADDCLTFEATRLAAFPPALQPTIRAVSRMRLQRNLLDIVLRAAGGGAWAERGAELSEAALRDRIARLQAATPRLVALLRGFGQIGAEPARAQVRDLVYQQARQLLAAVDRLLAQDALYRPSPTALQAWAEQKLTGAALFDQPDAAALEHELAISRERVATLARAFAAPLVTVLNEPELARPGMAGETARWLATVAELDRLDAQRPGNAVTALERFILVDLADPAAACARLSAADMPGGAGDDIFSARLRQLRGELAARCAHLDTARTLAGYVTIEDAFDRLLAGRYPFAPRGAQDAAPEAVAAFYDLFDRATPHLALTSEDAASFIETMRAARPLLAPASPAAEDGGVQVELQFRTNRAEEQGGDQIIQWRFASGPLATDSFAVRRSLVWHPGDRVSLSLRWAKDGYAVPTAAAGGSGQLEGNTLTYDFGGTWSLFAMIEQLRADGAGPRSDMAGLLGAESWRSTAGRSTAGRSMAGRATAGRATAGRGGTTETLLRLAFRTHPAGGGADAPGQVFATIALRPLGDDKSANQRLPLPRFPYLAPTLDLTIGSSAPPPRRPGVVVPRLIAPSPVGALASGVPQ